jgi:HAD superfamily hydrolase (TIGR01548 family)
MRFKRDRNPPHLDLLIFDMDGVLIDVSESYRKTIQRTIHIYLETCFGFERNKEWLITDEEISLFKSVGGFNNDWDLTSGLLLYLLSISGIPPSPKKKIFFYIAEALQYLQKKSLPFRISISNQLKKKHPLSFLEEVKSIGGGLKGVRRVLRASWDGWVYGSGDLDQENVVKRIFQEVYLGERFTSYYHLRPLFYKGEGLYHRERLLIRKELLNSLRKKVRLGIASGRPRFEAELALKRFQLLPYFDSVVTLDECEKEEDRILRYTGRKIKYLKPHPYSILRVVQEIGIPNPRCAYVGDVGDDILAAKAAKKKLSILAIGFLGGRNKQRVSKESLSKAGADLVIENPRDLLQLIS